jgi:hypothetical protein
VRAFLLGVILVAGCGGSSAPVDAGGDLVDPTAGMRTADFCPCPAGQLCVHPACCTLCYSRAPDAGCPMNQMVGGYCSNCTECSGDNYCSAPCMANADFCVRAAKGCDSITFDILHAICSKNGGGGGTCSATGLACNECY